MRPQAAGHLGVAALLAMVVVQVVSVRVADQRLTTTVIVALLALSRWAFASRDHGGTRVTATSVVARAVPPVAWVPTL